MFTGFEEETHTATEAEAHMEWHANAGVPLGQPCPWDACDPEPYEEAPGFLGIPVPTPLDPPRFPEPLDNDDIPF